MLAVIILTFTITNLASNQQELFVSYNNLRNVVIDWIIPFIFILVGLFLLLQSNIYVITFAKSNNQFRLKWLKLFGRNYFSHSLDDITDAESIYSSDGSRGGSPFYQVLLITKSKEKIALTDGQALNLFQADSIVKSIQNFLNTTQFRTPT